MFKGQDLAGILRSLQLIAEASVKLQEENAKFIWRNSNVRPMLDAYASAIKYVSTELPKNVPSIGETSKECFERVSTVYQGISAYRNLLGAGGFCTNMMTNMFCNQIS